MAGMSVGGWMAALERCAGTLPLMTTIEMKQTETSSLWTAMVPVKSSLFPNKPQAPKTLKTVLNKKKANQNQSKSSLFS